jgi:peptidoglycan/xylan/chitin deacetylase (PgdA/CDA1 family)
MPHGIDRPWIKEAAKETGFILVNWTYGADWLSTPEDQLEKSYINAIEPGAIFLFHDGGSKRDKSLKLTEAVIKAAQEQGYQIVPVGELLGIK